MTDRILFEEDVTEETIDKNIRIKKEHATNENASIEDNHKSNSNDQNNILHNDSNITQATNKNNQEITDKTSNTMSDNNTDNTQRVEGNTEHVSDPIQENSTNIPLNDTVEQCSSNNITADISYEVPIEQNVDISSSPADVAKVKAKKKPSELELLGVDLQKMEWDTQFDVFGHDSQIYRKYQLRKTEQQISYKEPANFPLKRRISSDDSSDDPSSLTCPVCEDTFETTRALKIHVHYHGNTFREFTCSICSENFKKNSELIAHKVVHSSESFVCQQCKLAFSDHCDYLLHNVIHSKASEIRCPECGLHYKRKAYKTHIMIHFSKRLSCPICSFATNIETNLQSHLNNVHNGRYECVECGKMLTYKKEFQFHMTTHTGVKTHQCLYCGKCFATKNMKIVHTRIHTGEKPYSCDICGHRAAQSHDILRHKMTHETEKKVSCEVCSKKFFRKESLLLHMTSHTKKDMYECPVCEQKLTTATGLKVHVMFKHTNERPVECTLCNRKFINNNQYRKHTRSKIHKRHAYGHMNQAQR